MKEPNDDAGQSTARQKSRRASESSGAGSPLPGTVYPILTVASLTHAGRTAEGDREAAGLQTRGTMHQGIVSQASPSALFALDTGGRAQGPLTSVAQADWKL